MKTSVLAGTIVAGIILVGAGAFVLSKDNSTEPTKANNNTTAQSSNQSPTKEATTTPQTPAATDNPAASDLAGPITTAQVALHNSKDDCWTIINNNVYDITSYIPRHSGGDNILSACGVDATAYFNGDKAGQEGGTNDHSSDNQALRELQKLKIGEL